MKRRSFLAAAAGAVVAGRAATPVPIIDTHIHLFDPTRPQGVPWPPKDNAVLYHPALPERYRKLTGPLGITGAVVIEASPWVDDNQWVLDLAAKDHIIVGTVGNLEFGKPDFAPYLERLHRNPLFRGIRNGNLWGRDLPGTLGNQAVMADLKRLSDAGLSLDTANQNPALIAAVVKITDAVPNLRIIIDHLPQMALPSDPAALRDYRANLHRLGERPNVYVKLSEVYRRVGENIPRDLNVYRATLDELSGVFGEDRVLYGSDWPNSDQWLPYPDVLHLIQEYFANKSQAANEKFFWRNSLRAYRWVKRDPAQPSV
jgi:predicted TIM-barrel fold metal-dependent hydrolase